MFISPREYILHMLKEIDYILSQLQLTDFASFLTDLNRKRAFVRSLENIGEAAKKIPDYLRGKQPEITGGKSLECGAG